MAKKLKRLRLTELSLVDRGANQFSSIGIFKSETPAKPLSFAERLEKAGTYAEIMALVAEAGGDTVKKQQDEQMPNDNPNANYEALVKSHAEKYDLSPSDAALDLMNKRPDLIAQAYSQDDHNRAIRMEAQNRRMYG